MESSAASKFQDHCGCATNPEIQAQLDTAKGEKVIFSCIVIKINRWMQKQSRILLLTDKSLYNIKKDQIQRKINVQQVKAVTKSIKDGCIQFVVHVASEYDYIYESEFRPEIFDALKFVYYTEHGSNLEIYGVPDQLKEYHTSKKDIMNGLEVNPQAKYRLKNEDIYDNNADGGAQANTSTGGGGSEASVDSMSMSEINMMNADFTKTRADTMFQKNKEEKPSELKDFTIKSVIGRGSFGKVFLVQKVGYQQVYAMKSLRKDTILDYDQIESTLLEKDILQKADHPFLVGMEYVFQTELKIFFVMKFVRGGELFMHLRKARQFSEERTKFYSLTVATALGHLHKQKIIYRDLKPENILMGEDGYICLTDFGLAKILEANEQAYSFCGTPEYLAPEILEEKGHAFPVDWWALGILTYEMIVGFPPFYTGSPNNQKMYDLIKTKPVFFPDAKKHGIAMSEECKDFISKCLQKNPKDRLGSVSGVDEILSHPWYQSINQTALLNKELNPEFKPKLSKNALDVSNFDSMFTDDEAVHSVLPQSAVRKIQNASDKFKGFDNI